MSENLDLINELIEAKADNQLASCIQEKIAALNIESVEDFELFCQLTEEKSIELEKIAATPLVKGAAPLISHTMNMRHMIGAATLGAIPAIIVGGYLMKHAKKKQSLEQVLKDKPDLKANMKRTTDHFDMLFHIAPTLMSNHIIAGSILEQLAQYDMIDHTMLGKLIEADRNMTQTRNQSNGMETIKAISETAGAGANMLKLLDV